MNKLLRTSIFILLIATLGIVAVSGQNRTKAPDYKIAKVKLLPFDEQNGKFGEELEEMGTKSFFNDLSTSLFITVEVSGEAGTFEPGRKATVTVMEGKKLKLTRTDQVGLIGDGGKYYMPVWLYGSMCSVIKVSVKLTGQKTMPTKTRTVQFACGE